MMDISRFRPAGVVLAGMALTGCVAAVPVEPTLTVVPGQGKTEANLRADDAACRGVPAAATTSGSSATAASTAQTAPSVSADQYYTCMASRGELVIREQPQPYPVYAGAVPYAYPAYPYPYYGYPYAVGYPYYGGYFGPYVGFGIGFGYGRFAGWHGGYGGWHGGYGGWHGGGYGGWHGGGFRR